MVFPTVVILSIGVLISLNRFFQSENIWDRLLNFNLISTKLLLIFTAYGIHLGNQELLDTSLTFVIVSFLVVVLISKFVISGGRTK